jgi:signal transduction histidine kinase
MKVVRKNIAERRALTDASLGAERWSADAATARMANRQLRALDDLIERDRIVADDRLMKFREGADRELADERSAAPAQQSSVTFERTVADEGKNAERRATDALLERERKRTDTFVETDRRENQADLVRLEARRQDTDRRLSIERGDADVAVAALDETKDALVRAQKGQTGQGDVLGMVTHDLRSPLCVIALHAQNIVELTQEDATRQAAQDMTRAAARMERLLADLLDVARIESGTLRIVKRPQDLSTLMAEVLRTYEPLFEHRHIAFAVDVPPAGLIESFDHDRIIQVLSNLLGNAMKFTPSQGTVRLGVERTDNEVEFVLRDSGSGIHPDALPHVFERFWQIDSVARRGLGLGLYICQKIVDGHGGRIWVDSEPGKGTTFRFTLPVSKEAVNPTLQAASQS